MSEQQSIKDTLDVIRKALEDDNNNSFVNSNNNILLLNKLVRDDGTINVIAESNLNKEETINILNKKLDDVFEKYLNQWLDKNVPMHLENYFKKNTNK